MRTNACAAASNVGCDENLGPAALAASWAHGRRTVCAGTRVRGALAGIRTRQTAEYVRHAWRVQTRPEKDSQSPLYLLSVVHRGRADVVQRIGDDWNHSLTYRVVA